MTISAPVLLLGALIGLAGWGGLNTAMEYTNRMEFCISCHEMEQTVYQEYLDSPHYRNASGVRATCPDCHVPREWWPRLKRKIAASAELYHSLVGTIDTVEKFEANRERLANRVWNTMAANDSHECRNCHSFEAMDFHQQDRRAREKMERAAEKGETCIECHKGIAHALPETEDDD